MSGRIPLMVSGIALLSAVTLAGGAEKQTVKIDQVSAEGVGKSIGTITIEETAHGLLITPNLEGLTPGLHGFHIHQNPQCGPAEKEGKPSPAEAAGPHLDPQHAGKHAGPYGEGHLGDLPPLFVDASGKATLPVLAPRLKMTDVKGHALMVHAGGDNYSDNPEKLGGGGARIACGVAQ